MDDVDRQHLARAIAQAETARARTAPNPAVGCVIAHGPQVVGVGATRPAGDAHAEVVALADAADRAQGATAYVTLAPCTHVGRTGACTDSLAAAGIQRVVIGLRDPNPVSGDANAALSARGLCVEFAPADGLFAATVRHQLEGFLTAVARGRPHMTLKLAQTTAGELVRSGPSRWITGAAARSAVHRWRASVDAVAVGVGTVATDDPQLTARDGVAQGAHQPRAVVFDSQLRVPQDATVVRDGTIILTTVSASHPAAGLLRDRGLEIARVAPGRDGRVDIGEAVRTLAELGVTTVFAEPGRRLAQAMVDADVVDRLVLHIAGDGGDAARPAIVAPACTQIERLGGAGVDGILHHVRPSGVPA
ncbi:MAG: bifunctional diaminohydroxyphosphoribosylaminopyrimidine deaminase/5-amino-6-(5-phosphoribosylamino)uracil reductase RibD [Nitriliruptoraceae bacterium]